MQNTITYSPGHPLYYKEGGKPLSFEEITPRKQKIHFDIPKTAQKIKDLILETELKLISDRKRYENLLNEGIYALSEFDLKMNGIMSYYTALGLKNAHISYSKSKLIALNEALRKTHVQLNLFN